MSTAALHETGDKMLDTAWVRAQFPSLQLKVNGHAAAFLDGPAGTQVPRQVIDAIQNYYLTANAKTSRQAFRHMTNSLRSTCFLAFRHIRKQL